MINLYYNSKNKLDKKVLAYLQDLDKKLLAIDVNKTNVSGTKWADISQNLNISVEDLIDKSLVKNDDNANYETHDWLKVLDKTPEALKFPIVIHNNNYTLIKDAQEALSFIESSSKNIDEKKYI